MTDQNNMDIWDQVCETDPDVTKRVNQRGGFTAIDSMSQIKKATELWGPFGGTWGLTDLRFEDNYGLQTELVGLTLLAKFWYPGGSFEIASDMPYKPNDDCVKKLQTECISKALSRLGFNADVFMGKFDDNRYVAEAKAKHSTTKTKPVSKKSQPQIPDPNPTEAGILGGIAQEYMKLLEEKEEDDLNYVDYKLLCRLVYEEYGKYPSKQSSIPKILKRIPLTKVMRENDFLDGLDDGTGAK